MSESFVDLSYRGLSLGRRIKLSRVQATSGYLETPAPMPVGTSISLATDDGLTLEAIVTQVHEQVGGTTIAPGMQVTPTLEGDAVIAWWDACIAGMKAEEAQVAAPAPVIIPPSPSPSPSPSPPPPSAPAPPPTMPPPTAPAPAERLTVRPRSHTVPTPPPAGAIPDAAEWQSDLGSAAAALAAVMAPQGRGTHPSNDHGATTVMQAVDPAILEEASRDSGPIETTGRHAIVDDGRSTTVMTAIDPATLGLDVSATGRLTALTDETTDVGAAPTGDDKKPAAKKRRKRKV